MPLQPLLRVTPMVASALFVLSHVPCCSAGRFVSNIHTAKLRNFEEKKTIHDGCCLFWGLMMEFSTFVKSTGSSRICPAQVLSKCLKNFQICWKLFSFLASQERQQFWICKLKDPRFFDLNRNTILLGFALGFQRGVREYTPHRHFSITRHSSTGKKGSSGENYSETKWRLETSTM